MTRENNLKSMSKLFWFLEKTSFSLAIIKLEIIDLNLDEHGMLLFLGGVFMMHFKYLELHV